MSDNHRVIEEPCEEKFSRTVLGSGGSREGVADFNFLGLDPIPVYGKTDKDAVFSGKRIKRGLYKTSAGQLINSDVNGSYNILRKAIPNAFSTLDRELRSSAEAGQSAQSKSERGGT